MIINKKQKAIKGLAVSALTLAMLPCLVIGAGQGSPNQHVLYDGHEAVPQRILVKYKSKANSANIHALRANLNAKQVKELKVTGARVLEIPGKDIHSLKAAIKKLRNSPFVEYAEPDYIVSIDGQPDDPQFSSLWGMHNTGQTGGTPDVDIDAPEAWDITTGGGTGVVMVIDTGIDYTHQDLAPNIWTNPGEIPGNGIDDDGNGYIDDIHGINTITGSGDPMDDKDHGTHVSGTIGAAGNDGVGVTGVNWNTQMIGCKFLNSNGNGSLSDAVECIEYAVLLHDTYGVDIRVTNNSWGGGGYSETLYNAINASHNAGMLFVAAAGNSYNDNDALPTYPTSYDLPNIISVAATDHNDNKAGFSNFGVMSVDLAAPGVSILSTVPGSGYSYKNGTSMASPHVAGAAMLAWTQFPTFSHLEIKSTLESTVDPVPGLNGKVATGGRLNLYGAVTCDSSNYVLSNTMVDNFEAILTQSQLITARFAENCTNAPVAVTMQASFDNGDSSLSLRDDGVAPDVVSDDGIYTADWVPGNMGLVTITFGVDYLGQSYATSVTADVLDYIVYEAIDTEPYNWIDISATGTPLSVDVLSMYTYFQIPFPITFYDQQYDFLSVTASGGIHFENAAITPNNQTIPSSLGLASERFLAPFWDDLSPNFFGGGKVYWEVQGVEPNRVLIVQYEAVPHYVPGTYATPGAASFQVIFYESNTDILMQYKDVSFGDPAYDNGASATVGIQRNAVFGQQYSYNEPVLQDQMAIRWTEQAAPSNVNYMLAAGGSHSCALDDNGVTCWGTGEASIAPTSWVDPKHVVAGATHACALDNSEVICWGSDAQDQRTVPPLVNPRQVAAGGYHTCALDANGVTCWGKDDLASSSMSAVPSDLINPTLIEVGPGKSCAIDDEGVKCWGSSGVSSLNTDVVNPRELSVSEYHYCVTDDTGVECFGTDFAGFLDRPAGLVNPRQLAGGDYNTCVLDDNGAYCWGWHSSVNDVPAGYINPHDIAVGSDHACILDDNGVDCWPSDSGDKGTPPGTLSFSNL